MTKGVVATRDGSLPEGLTDTMSDDEDRSARLHRVLKRLEQVCGQAEDLFQMARELKVEGGTRCASSAAVRPGAEQLHRLALRRGREGHPCRQPARPSARSRPRELASGTFGWAGCGPDTGKAD